MRLSGVLLGAACCLVALSLAIECALAVSRQSSAALNPGCGARCASAAGCLAVVNSTFTNPYTGQTDALVYVWSVFGAPLVHLDYYDNAAASSVDIDWDALLTGGAGSYGAIRRGNANYLASVVFDSVFEFLDHDDTARFIPFYGNALVESRSLAGRAWNCSMATMPSPVLVAKTDNFTITLTVPFASGRSPIPPRRILQTNSTQITVETLAFSSVDKAKVGVNVTLVGAAAQAIVPLVSTTIDDEYTPSIFQTVKVLLPHPGFAVGGYAQWKPCAYFGPTRKAGDRTRAEFVEEIYATTPPVPLSPEGGGSVWGANATGRSMLVAFGSPEDKDYNPVYVAWELSLGYGNTGKDELSGLVIAIIACCVGIPFAVIIGGIAFSFVRSRLGRVQSYTAIQ
eukprot:Opistho-1_new@76123